ncbi:hypothetical protein J3L18_31250 [Mucilaginibacter gossypii]|nr:MULTISPECIES: hypothetical protein [Mucilaginibacter]WMH62847.1 hypothetical protein J3L18_31250 [Mucilaginibacter gossypii]
MPVANAEVQMLAGHMSGSAGNADRLTSGYAIGGYYKNLAEVAVYGFNRSMNQPDVYAKAIFIAGGSYKTIKDSINRVVAGFEIDARVHGIFAGKRVDTVTVC